jgi:hydrogenase maturation factor
MNWLQELKEWAGMVLIGSWVIGCVGVAIAAIGDEIDSRRKQTEWRKRTGMQE